MVPHSGLDRAVPQSAEQTTANLDSEHQQCMFPSTMRVALLSGGVGGARAARAINNLDHDLTVIVNVGDDAPAYGLQVSPDLDTVMYTLADVAGDAGWGVAHDSFSLMDRMASFGIDTGFRIGDKDLATKLLRTSLVGQGVSLSDVTSRLAETFNLDVTLLPATNDPLATMIQTESGWIDFRTYFVTRRHQDRVLDVRFDGVARARPAPSVIEAIEASDVVIIAPSNPPLSIWPTLAIPGVSRAVQRAKRVIAISPLFGGKALKGPADRVLGSLGFSPGNKGVVEAYDGLLTDLIVDQADALDRALLGTPHLRVHVTNTKMTTIKEGRSFGSWLTHLL